MSGNLISTITNIQHLDNVGLQLNFTGSPLGSFQVQVSADYAQDFNGAISNPGNWTPLTLSYFNGTAFTSSQSIPTSVGSPIYLDLNQLSAPWIRLAYIYGSGSGTLNSFITAKMV